MRNALLTLAILLSLPAFVHAAPLNTADVAKGAKWLVHMDFDAMRNSKAGEHFRERMEKKEDHAARMTKFIESTGVDPRKDLHSATMYGTTMDKKAGVMVVRVAGDREKLTAHIKEKPDHKQTKHGDHVLHSWTHKHRHGHHHRWHHRERGGNKGDAEKGDSDKKDSDKGEGKKGDGDKGHAHKHHGGSHPVTACMKDDVIVFARDAKTVVAALDVLGGKSPNLNGGNETLTAKPVEGAFFNARAVGLADAKLPVRSPLVGNARQMTVTAGESGDEMFGQASLVTKSPETTQQMQALIEGFRAMTLRCGNDNEDCTTIIKGLKVTADESTLNIEWRVKHDVLVKVGDKMRARWKERKERRNKEPEGAKKKSDKDAKKE